MSEEKKILNLFTKKNNIFTPVKCVLCGDTFEPGEDIYLVDKEDNNSLVCDKCAKEDYKRGGVYRPIKGGKKMVKMDKKNADLIQSLNFDGITELKVKCILTSYTGGETWTISKQFGDIATKGEFTSIGVNLKGLKLISE